MQKKTIKKLGVFALSAVMALSMSAAAFAAGPSATPDVSSYTYQNGKTATGTVALGKSFTTNKAGKFPAVTTFNYEITPYQAKDNRNAAAGTSGTAIATSAMPLPTASTTTNHKVTVDNTNHKATVEVGNFPANASGTTQTNSTNYSITFTQPGYYIYKVKETGSTPANVPGVTYDTHDYYVAYYVTNKIDASGNTTADVYVHDITYYKNAKDAVANMPNVSELMNTTDNGGTAAAANGENVTGKVDSLTFYNKYVTQDIAISKNVTGNLGDLTKNFSFTVALTGLANDTPYTVTLGSGAAVTGASVGTWTAASNSFTATNGNATLNVTLKDNASITINALNVGANYTVTENASDHVASYKVTGANGATIVKASAANTASARALATSQETVDSNDGTVTVAYQNNRDLAAITGVPHLDMMVYALMALMAMSLIAFVVRRRKAVNYPRP